MPQRIQNLTLPQREKLSSAPAPELERHRRKCAICNHPDHEAIDEAFVRWHNPGSIYTEFHLNFDYAVIYRHTHATGLTALRSRILLPVLEHIIESADQVSPTAAGVISAIRAYVCLTNPGQWNEPPRHSIIDYNIHKDSPAPSSAPEAPPSAAPPAPAIPAGPASSNRTSSRCADRVSSDRPGEVSSDAPSASSATCLEPSVASSNREYEKLEPPLTHTKQTTAPSPNREKPPLVSAHRKSKSHASLLPLLRRLRAFSLSSLPAIAYNRGLLLKRRETHGQADRGENHGRDGIRAAARGHELRFGENRGHER